MGASARGRGGEECKGVCKKGGEEVCKEERGGCEKGGMCEGGWGVMLKRSVTQLVSSSRVRT